MGRPRRSLARSNTGPAMPWRMRCRRGEPDATSGPSRNRSLPQADWTAESSLGLGLAVKPSRSTESVRGPACSEAAGGLEPV